MAIQRQTPQFDPTRIVQPTATPIDTYFRPMLRQPEPSNLMQVAQALGGISPQLGRLASDAMAANIAAQREYGQYEASTEKDPEVLRRKATEAIENSGGIAPWRYQAFLEAYGQRMVRDKYRNALWNNLDDLSNPYNADGTVRAPTYIAEQMSKLYQDAAIPENSYFINKGAAAARAEADNSFYDRLMAARRQKVLEKSEEVLRDGLQFSIETAHDISSVFGPKGAIKALTDEYYRQGGQDGDKIMVDTVIAAARGAAAEGDFDRALALIRHPLNEKVGERTLGNRYRPELQQVFDQLYERSREAELNEARDTEALKQMSSLELKDKVLVVLQEERKKGPNINLDETQIGELVDRELSGMSVPDNIKAAVKARGVDWTRGMIDQMSNKTKREERIDTSSVNTVLKDARIMPRAEFTARADYLLQMGLIDFPMYERATTINRSMNGLQEVDRQRMMAAVNSISGVGWAGMTEQQIAVDGRAELSAIGDRAAIDVMDAFFAEINTGAFKQKYPDEIERSMAQSQILDRLVREKQTQLRGTYQSRLEQFNLTESFDATVGPAYSAEIDQFMELVLADLGLNAAAEGMGAQGPSRPSMDAARLSRRVSAIMLDRLRDEWEGIAAAPGQPPMTLEQRKRSLYGRIPDIQDRMYQDIRLNPDSLGLPQDLVNIIKSRTAMDQMSVATDISAQAGPTGAMTSPLDISRGITLDGKGAIRENPNSMLGGVSPEGATFKFEADMFDQSKAATKIFSEMMQNPANATPENRTAHNKAKGILEQSAKDMLVEMRSVTVDKGFFNPKSVMDTDLITDLKRRSKDSPIFRIQEDGVYTPVRMQRREPLASGEVVENGVVYAKNPLISNKYWTAKAIIGYTPEEVRSGKTEEGVRIGKDELDANEFLFFRSADELTKAVEEYTNSNGRSGYIAEYGLKMSGMTFNQFRDRQTYLLAVRKPI